MQEKLKAGDTVIQNPDKLVYMLEAIYADCSFTKDKVIFSSTDVRRKYKVSVKKIKEMLFDRKYQYITTDHRSIYGRSKNVKRRCEEWLNKRRKQNQKIT